MANYKVGDRIRERGTCDVGTIVGIDCSARYPIKVEWDEGEHKSSYKRDSKYLTLLPPEYSVGDTVYFRGNTKGEVIWLGSKWMSILWADNECPSNYYTDNEAIRKESLVTVCIEGEQPCKIPVGKVGELKGWIETLG